MKIICSCLILLFLLMNEINSQTDSLGIIRGYIVNSTNGKNLSDIIVYLENYNISAETNMDGYFEIYNSPTGIQSLTFSCLGFKTIKKIMRVQKGENKIININLEPILLCTNEVVINSNSGYIIKELFIKPVSHVELTTAQINKIPGLGEADLLRTLQTIPGIQSISDYSSMLYVRGGTPGENLYLIDGTVVYNPEHAFGMFSTFNSSSIEKVKLLKGGFGAEYGGRLSSVLDVTNYGSNLKNFKCDLTLSLLSGSLVMNVPIGNLGFIAGSFRRTYLDHTAAKIIEGIPPYYFWDGSLKTMLNIGNKNKITVNYFGSRDNLNYILNKEAKEKVGFVYDWRNVIGSINWNWIITKFLFAGFSFSGSKYTSRFNFEEIRMNELNKLEDYTLKSTLEYFCSKYFTFRFGYEYKIINNLLYEDLTSKKIDITRQVNYQTGFVTTAWNPSASLNIEAGLRFDYFNSQTEYKNLDPRISFKYHLNESTNLKFSAGIYHQYINRLPRLFIANIITTADKFTSGSFACHYIAGYQKELGNSIILEIESYLKVYKNIYQFNQNFSADVNPNYYSIDNKPLIVESCGFYNRGDGKSYGIELFLKKECGAITGWFGYTLARTEVKFEGINTGKSFVPRFDRFSTINLSTSVDLFCLFKENQNQESSKLLVGMNFIYGTGVPFTLPSSVYSVQKLPDWTNSQYNVSIYPTEINTMRLPPYIRLDFSISYEKQFNGWSVAPYFQFFNVLNRKNIWFLNYDIETNDKKIILHINRRNMLPFLPSVGINIKFIKTD